MLSFSTSERFSALEPADRERLEELTKLDQFAPGEEVLAAGRPSDWLSIICSGAIELVVPGPDGRDVVLAALGPGDIYGELETFADLPLGLRHVARVETLVRACPKAPLKQELRARRSLATGLLFTYCRSISEKIRLANEAVSTLGIGGGAQPGRGSHLTADERAWLSLLGEPCVAAAGERVVREGDSSRAFYVVQEGALEVRKSRPGAGELVLANLGPGDLFGLLSFLDGRPRSATVAASGEARLVRIEESALEGALRVNFTVAFRFLGTLCRILGRTFADTAEMVAKSARR